LKIGRESKKMAKSSGAAIGLILGFVVSFLFSRDWAKAEGHGIHNLLIIANSLLAGILGALIF
jgi:hypothetical protein